MSVEVRHPKAEGYDVRIGTTHVRTAISPETPLRYYTRDSLAQRQDQLGSIYENVLDLGYAFSRTNYSGGEGLDWDPRELSIEQATQALDQISFWDSRNVNIIRPKGGDQFTVDLANLAIQSLATLGGPPVSQAVSSSFWYVAFGSTVERRDDADDSVATDTFSFPADVVKVVTGPTDEVAVLLVDGTVHIKPGKSDVFDEAYDAVPAGEFPIDDIWYVKQRFMVVRTDPTEPSADTEYGELVLDTQGTVIAPEVDGTFVLLDTLHGTITDCISSGPAILASDSDGHIRSYVTELDGTTNLPVLTIQARIEMPKSETCVTMGDSSGTLIFVTKSQRDFVGNFRLRLYRAEVLPAQFNYAVGQIQFLREWSDVVDDLTGINSWMWITRDLIYFPIFEGDGISYAWQFDIVTGGLVRAFAMGPSTAFAPIVFQSQPFWIQTESPNVLFTLTSIVRQEGYIITPNISFGLNTDINWISSVIEVTQIPGGTAVELWRSTNPVAILDPDHESWVLERRIQDLVQSGEDVPMSQVTGRTLALKLVLVGDSADPTETPKVSRIGVRGLPVHRDWIVEVPVNISDIIEVPFRRPVKVPNYGDFVHLILLSLQGKHIDLTIIDPPLLFRGIVDNLMEPVEFVSDRGSTGRYCMLQFRGDRITFTSFPTGNQLMGLGTIGIGIIGMGQSSTDPGDPVA